MRRAYRILVTGSRDWPNQPAVARSISGWLRTQGTTIGGAWPFPIVVHGHAGRGADQHADDIATGWGWTPEQHPADWPACAADCPPGHRRRRRDGVEYCPTAGHRRNAAMVAAGADVCLTFALPTSRGTRNCARLARAAGITVVDCGDPTGPARADR